MKNIAKKMPSPRETGAMACGFVGQPLALPVGKRALAMDRIKTP
jgi:hypothetical protein